MTHTTYLVDWKYCSRSIHSHISKSCLQKCVVRFVSDCWVSCYTSDIPNFLASFCWRRSCDSQSCGTVTYGTVHFGQKRDAMEYVQALCTCIPMATRISTMLPPTDSLSGGEHGVTASSAVSHIIRPDAACYTKVNTGWPCLRCSQTTGLEQPSGRHPSLSIIGNFQTFIQVPPFSAVFFAHS